MCWAVISRGWQRPAASTSSFSAFSVFWWKLATRWALSGTTSARWRCGSWVVTPVGQWPVWQAWAWMQPSANMKPRPELHQSAPRAIRRTMSKAVVTLPAQPILIWSRRFRPTRVLCTSSRPSCSGAPTLFVNSSGAAPVPPSAPSTTMKSGVMPVSSMALQTANHSQGWPMQSLKPVGLPPDRFRSLSMNCIISTGVENALWRAGEMQAWPTGTPRAAAISGVTLGPGSTPPWPGLAP
mmetsp:Transcript_9623/g.22372  ORF Transcript_9623/g.22372 Transcript_9623/m.22372 type:complete len:239 (-) Transcript_9623:174-890(-)